MGKVDLLMFVQSFGDCGMKQKGLFQQAQHILFDRHFFQLQKDELVNLLWSMAMYWNANADEELVQRILSKLIEDDSTCFLKSEEPQRFSGKRGAVQSLPEDE